MARLFTFVGGTSGLWRMTSMVGVVGAALPEVDRLAIVEGEATGLSGAWQLRGITSNERYVERAERQELASRQPVLGRPDATRAALIPIRKRAGWWGLSQDERRHIFEERSRHIAIGLRHLPAVARRLHHCRDLGDAEPFDFLTWFEYAPSDEAGFDQLLAELRASEEWRYVEREVEVRATRA